MVNRYAAITNEGASQSLIKIEAKEMAISPTPIITIKRILVIASIWLCVMQSDPVKIIKMLAETVGSLLNNFPCQQHIFPRCL